MTEATLLHATCIVIKGRGVLLTGPSGSGKSDLALRLMDRGAQLVSDDYVSLHNRGGTIFATAPARIAGLLEVRGLGIVTVDAVSEAEIHSIIELDRVVERMPAPRVKILAGVPLPVITISPFEASAPIKLEWHLSRIGSE